MSPPFHWSSWLGNHFSTVLNHELEEGDWNRIHIANYGVTCSGLNLIEQPILDFLNADQENNTIRIVVGWDGVTTVEAIQRLLAYRNASNNRVQISIFHVPDSAVEQPPTPIFHPKIYVFSNDNAGALFVGSHNLTEPGLSRNMEVSLEIRGQKEDYSEINDSIAFINQLGGWVVPQGAGGLNALWAVEINSIEDLQVFIGAHPGPVPPQPPADEEEEEEEGDDENEGGVAGQASNFSASLAKPQSRRAPGLEIPNFEVAEGDEEDEEEEQDEEEEEYEMDETVIWWTNLPRYALNVNNHLREGSSINSNPNNNLRLGRGQPPHHIEDYNDANFQYFFRENLIPVEEWNYAAVGGRVIGTAQVDVTLATPGNAEIQTTITLVHDPNGADMGHATTRNINLRFNQDFRDAFSEGVNEQEDDGNEITNDGNPNIPVGYYIRIERQGLPPNANYRVSIIPPPE